MPTEINELKNNLKVVLTDPNLQPQGLDLLFQLIERLKNTRIPEAWTLAREALHMAQQQNNQKKKADAYSALANCSWKMAQHSLAVEYFEKALNIYLDVQDRKGVASCYSGMGIVSAETGELEQALEYFERAMQYIKLLPASNLAAVITGNVGHTHFKLLQFEEAMHCFEHALNEHTAFGDEQGVANMLGGMAGVHVQRGEYNKGLELLEKVEKVCRSDEPSRSMAVTKMNTGITLLRMGRYYKAKKELEQARYMIESIRFTMYEPEILKHLMHASIELEEVAEFNKYLQLYEEHRYEDIIQQARERHQQFKEFQNAETRSIEQILN